jgi:hypothetical protein
MEQKDTPMGKAFTIAINIGEASSDEGHEEDGMEYVTNSVIKLAPAESMYVASLHEIVEKYGKLADDDDNGIYVGYVGPEDNKENASKGVMCGNCAFYCPKEKNCHIITIKVKPGGYCRLAAIGEGLVSMKEK